MSANFSRRRALSSLGLWAAASPLLNAQDEAPRRNLEAAGRIAPRAELVNVPEFEVMAQRKLAATTFSTIADGDRRAFERIIFRPRMLVNTTKLDLSVDLFGEKLFAPIIVGPASDQQRYHPEAELATARGAAAGKAVMVISDRSSQPIEKIAAAKGSLWYQVYPQAEMDPVLTRVQQAVKAGCKVVCLTVGTPYRPEGAPLPGKLATLGDPHMSWSVVDRLRQAAKTPIVLKGIMSPDEARAAVEKGVQGIVVSNHGGVVPGLASPIEVLPSVVAAVGGRIPVLIDGGFRRGSDIVKALALGARAVLVTRPALWGLAAYGADGVQGVIELLQSGLHHNRHPVPARRRASPRQPSHHGRSAYDLGPNRPGAAGGQDADRAEGRDERRRGKGRGGEGRSGDCRIESRRGCARAGFAH